MSDSFFRHWGGFLDKQTARALIDVNTIVPAYLSSGLTVHCLSLDAKAAAVHTVAVRTPEFFRVIVRRPRARISTIAFADPAPIAATDRDRPAPRTRQTPKHRYARPPAPAGIPLRERLQSLLQPPMSAILGDQRLWLPTEPFPFQYDGIHFLVNRWSALLADEMGLGKTMQAITAVRLLLRAGMVRSVLVVCPKPLVTNWDRELQYWAEEIPVTCIGGNLWSRQNRWLHDPNPVKLVNYESLSRDEQLFQDGSVSFDLVVLDEAQRIKNRDSKISKVVRSIRRKRSWVLTGTPVENRPGDLVSLLEFIQQRRIDIEERPDLIRDTVADFLLRRTKDQVLNDLPPKRVHDTYVDLGPNQRQRYAAAEQDGVVRLNDLGEQITIEHVFELIRRLKQICNFDPLTGESTKADQLRADLDEIAESGQKAIVFSQWVTTLERLADVMGGYRPLMYHGKVPQRRRDGILTDFRDDPDRPLLLLSYGAGAVGLNLQFSNYVFLFDRWWNPAVEDQAINRAHRVGQKQPVFVSRFLVPGTIEERIAEVLERKREMFSFLIDDHDPIANTGMTRNEVFSLFDLKVRPKSAA